MLSRMANIVLAATVILLAVALVRNASSSSTDPESPASDHLSDRALAAASADQLLQTADSINDPSGLAMLDSYSAGSPALATQPPASKRTASAKPAGDGDRAPRPAMPPLQADLIDQCIQVARDIDIDRGDRLASLRQKDPQEFDRVIRYIGPRMLAMAQLKQRDPDLYDVKIGELSQTLQVTHVAAELREAIRTNSQGEIPSLQEQLRNLLRIQLALSMKSRAEYLCRLEDQIKSLREALDRDGRHFNDTVEARYKALLQLHPPVRGESLPAALDADPAPASPNQ